MYITKTITIAVHATADDWQLYDLPGREDAAIALNQRFEQLVNKGTTRSEVRNAAQRLFALGSQGPHASERLRQRGRSGHRRPLFRRGSFRQDIRKKTMNAYEQ